MARPSMTALLAVLAVAGYQHRDKLAEMLGGAMGGGQPGPGEAGRRGGQPIGQGGAMQGAGMQGGEMHGGGGLASGGMAGGIGGMLRGGLSDLLDRFRQTGHGDTADSWVAQGPNKAVQPQQLEQAIGPETLDALARQTGLPREEIVARLTRTLPDAVDKYTPDGRLPAA